MAQEPEFIYEEYSDGVEQVLLELVVRLRSNKARVDQVTSELKSIEDFINGLTDEEQHVMFTLGGANPLFNEFAESYGRSIKKLENILR